MERRAIAIRGTVQGVGFRPFVHKLASELDLGGFVQNDAGGVQIEVEGDTRSLDQFLSRVIAHPPPLAKIDEWTSQPRPTCGERRFHIDASNHSSHGAVVITPDAATCDLCLAELFDPSDRRYRYPFTNCTHCGPRLSIVTGAPYDREFTTMASFAMCPACRREYEDPCDRRFHAQPIACAECGPKLTLLDSSGQPVDAPDPLALFVDALRQGKIGAMKGLGGYHLICDARNPAAVAELRSRKHRDEKPLAIMVGDLAAAEAICSIDPAAGELLSSMARPIVLLPKRARSAEAAADFTPASPYLGKRGGLTSDATRSIAAHPLPRVRGRGDGNQNRQGADDQLALEVAPGNPFVGVMLPYTPLHHLLLAEMDGVPLVMTSGNQSDEPIAYEEADAVRRLAGIADIFLTHNRPIHVRCDDSVTRIIGGVEAPIRRSRGYAPQPITLPMNCPTPILAVGGQMKGTFALGQNRQAIVSQHMGDLDNFEAFTAFKRDVALYEQLFSLKPACIAHDLHPDYASMRYAAERAVTGDNPISDCQLQGSGRDSESTGFFGVPQDNQRINSRRHLKLLPVQHHHAHMASCMAEHGLTGPVIGVTLDGTGFGTDGAIWGGEFLVGDYRSFRRAAHLRYVGLPGGEQAVREPWRMAVSYLHDAGTTCAAFEKRIEPQSLATIRRMIDRRFNTPMTSSAGRLFDAVAALAGVRDRVSYEGQAAMQLEWLATDVPPVGVYPFSDMGGPPMSLRLEDTGVPPVSRIIDTRPMIRAIVDDIAAGVSAAIIARKFHSTWIEIISATCRLIREDTGLNQVVFSGGVFMNALLSVEAFCRLTNEGFLVYRHRRVPSNDGGLSLGQVAIAAAQLSPA